MNSRSQTWELRFHPDKVVPANVRVDTLHVKKLLHALDEIDVKLLLELGFGFGFNAVYKVTDVPWVVVEIAQMFVNNQTVRPLRAVLPVGAPASRVVSAVVCGAAFLHFPFRVDHAVAASAALRV